MRNLNGLYILDAKAYDLIYGPAERRRIEQQVSLVAEPQTRESIAKCPALLHDVDVIFSGWGAPLMDESFLDAAPRFKAFFYGAGTVGYCMTEAVWERGIVVTSANVANAIPVAEYTLSMILFSLKHGWRLARQTREQRTFVERNDCPGGYGATVGIISLGSIGRKLLELLSSFELRVLVYDPFLTSDEARRLGVESVTLPELFHQSHVVSLHTPQLAETEGMITGQHLSLMKHGATFINTARGEIVKQDELIEVARRRPDLQFVLDVADPEPPTSDSPLYDLPNVVLTPHIAGSAGAECRRMGKYIVEELERYVAGISLRWSVARESVRYSTHRLPVRVTVAKRPKHSVSLSTPLGST